MDRTRFRRQEAVQHRIIFRKILFFYFFAHAQTMMAPAVGCPRHSCALLPRFALPPSVVVMRFALSAPRCKRLRSLAFDVGACLQLERGKSKKKIENDRPVFVLVCMHSTERPLGGRSPIFFPCDEVLQQVVEPRCFDTSPDGQL